MIKRFDECDRMSQIIVFDKYFKTAGQVAFEPSGDIKKQTTEVLAELDALFENRCKQRRFDSNSNLAS